MWEILGFVILGNGFVGVRRELVRESAENGERENGKMWVFSELDLVDIFFL